MSRVFFIAVDETLSWIQENPAFVAAQSWAQETALKYETGNETLMFIKSARRLRLRPSCSEHYTLPL